MTKSSENSHNNMYISIIVASYNYARYLRENLDSLLNQTYTNFEVLVIDDGSTDNSLEIIKEYVEKDSRFKLLTHENNVNKGLSESVYLALSHAKGTYIAFCESDDYWTCDHLEKYVNYINKFPETDFLTARIKIVLDGMYKGMTEIIDEYNQGFFTHYQLMRSIEKPRNIHYPMLDTYTFPTFSVVMVRSEKLKQCDFSPLMVNGLDLYLWKQLGLSCKVGFIDEQLAYWRRSGESLIHERHDYDVMMPKFSKVLDAIGGHRQVIKNKLYRIFQNLTRAFYRKKRIDNTIIIRVLGFIVSKYHIELKEFS